MISLSYLHCFYSSVYVKTKAGWSLSDLLTLPPQAGLTQLQHHQTLQCLWADFQAVFELWIKVLKEIYFASWAFANNSLQFPAGCSWCKYIMWGWGFRWPSWTGPEPRLAVPKVPLPPPQPARQSSVTRSDMGDFSIDSLASNFLQWTKTRQLSHCLSYRAFRGFTRHWV